MKLLFSDDEDTVYPLNKKRDDVLSSYARKIDISAHSKKQQGFSFKLLPKTSSLTISAREVATGGELVPLFDLSIDGPFKVLVGKNKWLFLDNDTKQECSAAYWRYSADVGGRGFFGVSISGFHEFTEQI
ncbi:hypothetical protein Ga0003345_0002 [Idiomarinaceae bacterium HL-53]|nr:hypothetical protein Ga0003345_0002 [Idiomarinaceae bacterium HL-53]